MSEQAMQLTINGETLAVNVDPSTPLLWVLRDHLKMQGTKFGCGMAQCGACTVVVDGNATRSCVMPVEFMQGKHITTIEGLALEHPIKQAWLEHDVPQCGYCQSGQMMSAFALLKEQPNASPEQIQSAMAGNICRCGTYPKIFKAINTAQQALAKELAYEA